MKIKIGDITARQKQRICESKKSCQDCKLSRGWYFPECMYSDSSYLDVEVELPDRYFDNNKEKEKMKQFKIIHGKGFHLPIGDYILSVQFGYGSYCNNYRNDEYIDKNKTVRCENAEVAILSKDGRFITQKMIDRMAGAESIKDKMQDEDIITSATPDEVCQIIAFLITLDNLKKAGAI